MDGFKTRLKNSIQFRLSFYLTLTILIIAIPVGIFSFRSAFHEAYTFQDNLLRQVAALFYKHQVLASSLEAQRNNFMPEMDDDTRVIVQFLPEGSQYWENLSNTPPLPIPTHLKSGFFTLKIGHDSFRVFIKTIAKKQRIAVLQETDARDDAARHSALRTMIPLFILLPILLGVVANLVHKMFRPILLLSKEIEQRSEQQLHPVDSTHFPIEIRPFALSINQLLERVAHLLETQRRFIADAAHELRSPMTALSLQAERLAETNMSSLAQERLGILRRGIERGRNLLDQLLTLAGAQSHTHRKKQFVSIQAIYRHVLEDMLAMAQAKQIDIGLEETANIDLFIDEMDLTILIKNLVDNAIRYTPTGGKIDLSAQRLEEKVVLHIKDTGPGIPEEERERVFDPFYRVLGNKQVGSGLGLSIVKTMIDRMGGHIELSEANLQTQTGLCVSIYIPVLSEPH